MKNIKLYTEGFRKNNAWFQFYIFRYPGTDEIYHINLTVFKFRMRLYFLRDNQ